MTSRPAVPGSETPREIFYLPRNGYAGNQPAVWLDDWRRMRRRAEEAERCESLAQTEIKGHMRVEDELKVKLNEADGDYFEVKQQLAQAQARIAELEKVLWNFHLTQARRSTPEAAERAFNELLEVSAALKSRA